MNKSIRQMLSLILCLLLCAGLLPGRVWAAEIVDSGTCGDNLTWTLDSEGTLTISGTGEMEDYDWNSFPWYGKRGSIHTVEIRSGVTSIGVYAFDNCTRLTSVSISDSVTSIGYAAFHGCRSLPSVSIPDSVTSIGGYAFSFCSDLSHVSIPESVTSIAYWAFHETPWLWRLGDFAIVNHILLRYQGDETDVTIPSGVTSIAGSAFYDCSSLTSVTIPDSVTSINYEAFAYCSSLTSVSIPNSVTSIGSHAFDQCINLTSVSIPNSVTSIGADAFSHCGSLTSVTIPDSVTSIASYAFNQCYSLTSVTIPDSVTSICNSSFELCSSLTSVIIPDSVTSIDDRAFEECSSLTDVYYGGTEDQWIAIEGGGKPTGDAITVHFCFDADPSNPLGQSQPNIVGEGDKAAAVVNFASPADRPMIVCGVRYSAAGQLLGIDAYPLEAGQFGQLVILFENGDYLRVFAMDADTCAPLCKNLQVDRPA